MLYSSLWGSPTSDRRGELVEEWAATCDLGLINVGEIPTCVRPQGSSVIDLTWISPCLLERVGSWMVLEDMETLSDHQYVQFVIRDANSRYCRSRNNTQKKWNFAKLDCDLFAETLEFLANASIPDNSVLDPESYVVSCKL